MNYKQCISESSSMLVGLRQVLRGIQKNEVRCVVVALDSEDFVKQCVLDAIDAKCVKVVYCPTRRELGLTAGVDVPTAVVGLV